MTSLEGHRKKIREHIEETESSISIGTEKRGSTIGFHCSIGAAQLLEYYLHRINKISSGKQIKHNWFKAPSSEQKIKPLAERKIGVDFPRKTEIYSLICEIEKNRDKLIYGKADAAMIKKVIENFQKLRSIIESELGEAL